jgi:hypothetical protein
MCPYERIRLTVGGVHFYTFIYEHFIWLTKTKARKTALQLIQFFKKEGDRLAGNKNHIEVPVKNCLKILNPWKFFFDKIIRGS